MPVKKICCIGAGYVGGPSCAVIAHKCPDLEVEVVDLSQERIDQWNSDELPIFEPGLKELVMSCRDRNLRFSTDMDRAVKESDIIFLCVNTPTKTGRATDLQYVETAVWKIAQICNASKIVVDRSTVPVKAAETVSHILNNNAKPGVKFEVLSNPEFLITGRAVTDCLNPDRVLIGRGTTSGSLSASLALSWIYEHWVPREKIITMDTCSSELTKLTQNAFAAQRYSSMNSMSAICEKVGADILDVEQGLGKCPVIGPAHLKSTLGFGGSCLQKDVLQLVYMCECIGLPEVAEYWQQVIDMNNYQKKRFVDRVKKGLGCSLKGKKIAIFGFAFKQGTRDTRDSQAIFLCQHLLDEAARLRIYDPQVKSTQIYQDLFEVAGEERVSKLVTTHGDPYTAADGCHALVVCTEWDQFKTLDYRQIFKKMVKPASVFDGHVILNHPALINIGFHVESIGRNLPTISERKDPDINTDYLILSLIPKW